MKYTLIKIYEEVGNRCDMEFYCDKCGDYEYPTDENGETNHIQMYKYEGKIYCKYCLDDVVNELKQV